MYELTTGQALNRKVLESGCVALVNLDGTRLEFYPRGRLPAYLSAYLNSNATGPRRLAQYCINLGRDIYRTR